MAICKAPTLRLKALSKHTHIMYIEMEKCYKKKKEKKKKEIDRGSSITMQKMRTHTRTLNDYSRDWVLILVGVEIL